MLRTILLALGVIGLLAVALVVWRLYATVAGGARVTRELLLKISPVHEALREGRDPDPGDVHRFAEARDTRKILFETLEQYRRGDLFPRELRSWETMAEADLVNWLLHPNELGAAPDEIQLMATVPAPAPDGGTKLTYFVFRFRMHPPHWAAAQGWTAGIAGPYPTRGDPAPYAPGTFSRFEPFESRSPEEHVAMTHGRLRSPPRSES